MKDKFQDDGQTIVSMDVDRFLYKDGPEQNGRRPGKELTKDQMREVLKGSIKASLVVAGVFSTVLIIFVLFCTQIWFR